MKLWRYGCAIERLGERYRLDGVLGSGGMADVCLAWDEREEREVAVKVIKSGELDQRTLDRFLKEAAQVAKWRHPNIVRIYGDVRLELLDAGKGSIVPYIVMELAEGGDLHKRLTPNEPYPFAETLQVFDQLCQAVSYAHSQGVIHRDLKPLNILFRLLPDDSEQAVLSDFGLAVEMDATHFTFAGAGTLPYMAPEQLLGKAEPASDIFALGVILYQLCTGRLPFRRSIQDLRRRGPQALPPVPSSLQPDLPLALDQVIFTALAEEPSERFADAALLWQAVERAVAGMDLQRIALRTRGQGTVTSPTSIYPGLGLAADSAPPSNPEIRSAREVAARRLTPPPPGNPSGPLHPQNTLNVPEPLVRRASRPVVDIGYRSIVEKDNSQPEASQKRIVPHSSLSGIRDGQNWTRTPPAANDPEHLSALEQGVSGKQTEGYSVLVQEPSSKAARRERPNASRGVPSAWMAIPPSSVSQPTPMPVAAPAPRWSSADWTNTPPTPSPPVRPADKARFWLVVSASCTLAAFVVAAAILAFMSPDLPIPGRHNLPGNPAPATITITPDSQAVQDSYQFHATNKPDANNREVAGQVLTASSQSQPQAIQGTGHRQTPGVAATGTLTFTNGAFASQTVAAGTVIVGKDGVQVITDKDAVIASANSNTANTSSIDVSAHAVNIGAKGNIVAMDVNKICCIANGSIFVRNLTAFTGGQDPQSYVFVQQGDVDGVVTGMKDALTKQAQDKLKGMLPASQQFAGDPQCQATMKADQPVGDTGANVPNANVTVTYTCTANSYDNGAAQTLASNLLTDKANGQVGQGYQLVGKVTTQVSVISTNANSTALQINAQGKWSYQLSAAQKQDLVRQIAGKSAAVAKSLLERQMGIKQVSITADGGTLPGDPANITLVVQPATGTPVVQPGKG